VVTVPAYFTDRQRQGVKEAGRLVELEVVRIINEPTAASLAYGLGKGLQERVLVYDLGGGTFDVSIIEIRDRVFEVKSTGGDIFLGGFDFDDAVIRYVLEDFQSKHGIDLAGDPVAMQRVRDLAERTKIDLSARTEAPFSIPFITMTPRGQPLNIDLRFTRPLLEQLTQHLVDRTVSTVAQVLADAGLESKDIDEVMLVGGQTRMPLVQERLTAFFGKPPSKGVHADEAVAIGAALYGWSLQESSDLKLQLLDVIPMAIGLEGAGGKMHVVFPRNASIPNAWALAATSSVDNQSELMVRIFQGDGPQVTGTSSSASSRLEGASRSRRLRPPRVLFR
jgi:molecular chaperone DnaK